MLTRIRRGDRRVAIFVIAALTFASAACDKVPLLAPTGTVITLFPTATTVPLNGEVEIIGTVIENGVATAPPSNGNGNGGTGTTPGTTPTTTPTPTQTPTSTAGSGTPVQNGTLVTFTTTIGRIEPSEARTNNGQVRVRFLPGGQSGVATITAFSGGASGRIENLRVGTAAAERVILTATPQTLSASGGTADIAARVEDVNGLGLSGVAVNFIADAGTLSAGTATTDQSGVAHVNLTTSRQAKVTANVAGKTAEVTVGLNPRTGIAITPPTDQLSAGQRARFTIAVAAPGAGGSTAAIRDVTVSWGDGSSQSLGALSGSTTVDHIYAEPGSYTVRATATDTSNFSESVSTSITILPAQPPTVTLNAPTTATVGQAVRITATVSGNTSTIIRYEWSFGADADRATAVTTSNTQTVTYSRPGTKIVTVRVIQASGPEGENSTAITITGTASTAGR
jgi:hypothetical protein